VKQIRVLLGNFRAARGDDAAGAPCRDFMQQAGGSAVIAAEVAARRGAAGFRDTPFRLVLERLPS
jgi:hypothetical protein